MQSWCVGRRTLTQEALSDHSHSMDHTLRESDHMNELAGQFVRLRSHHVLDSSSDSFVYQYVQAMSMACNGSLAHNAVALS